MAAMSTSLTEFSDLGDKRTYTISGHTISKPRVVVCQRRLPVGNQITSEVSVSVVYATEDDEGNPITSKPTFKVSVTQPITGQSTDVDAALAVFRDIVAGDEFANSIATAEFLS